MSLDEAAWSSMEQHGAAWGGVCGHGAVRGSTWQVRRGWQQGAGGAGGSGCHFEYLPLGSTGGWSLQRTRWAPSKLKRQTL
jgi:hypothetical protein